MSYDLKKEHEIKELKGNFNIFYDKDSQTSFIRDSFINNKTTYAMYNKSDFNQKVDSFTFEGYGNFIMLRNSKIFVADNLGYNNNSMKLIRVFDQKNKTLLNTIETNCNDSDGRGRFSVNDMDNIVYSCYNDATICLVNANGTKIGSPIPIYGKNNVTTNPLFAYLDTKGRIVVAAHYYLQIFI